MSAEAVSSNTTRRLRRVAASAYLKERWDLDYAPRTLAKFACIGGSPKMQYVGRFPLYPVEDLDAWAKAKIAPPVSSTSERQMQIAA